MQQHQMQGRPPPHYFGGMPPMYHQAYGQGQVYVPGYPPQAAWGRDAAYPGMGYAAGANGAMPPTGPGGIMPAGEACQPHWLICTQAQMMAQGYFHPAYGHPGMGPPPGAQPPIPPLGAQPEGEPKAEGDEGAPAAFDGAGPPTPAAAPAESLTTAGGEPLAGAAAANDDDGGDIDDLCAGMEESGIAGADDAATAQSDNILRTRTYDLSITYDKYWQTPRMWFFGYDEASAPLTQPQIFEDILSDYAKRTVTFERHPHLDHPHASIHPCKHPNAMKKIIDNVSKHASGPPRVDQAMFIFLKFISNMSPTINATSPDVQAA
ncbi:Atg8 ligase [Aureococcus anophagefferens]|nr:Atg8 ligase [Aureococcus anophagefferens]